MPDVQVAWDHSDFLRIENATQADVADPERFAAMCRQTRQGWTDNAMPQVRALLTAGWKYEIPEGDADPWQWAWRSPPKRTNSMGRRYASTNQAFNALQRLTATLPVPEAVEVQAKVEEA
jgi:hypothetical protein